jgi:hypothetical protein
MSIRNLPVAVIFCCIAWTNNPFAAAETVEQWGVFETTLKGPADGNPFTDVTLGARFENGGTSVKVSGFYDGEGTYRVRFMPAQQGEWRFTTTSNRAELADKTGSFTCIKPSAANHGPIRVSHTFHFAYADGTPYFQIGTTCYSWIHQRQAMQDQTIETLKTSPFNKIRMCILPTRALRSLEEPILWPFEGTPPTQWDFARPNPKFFQMLEKRVAQLSEIGVEADLIIFHPYARPSMGLDKMDATIDDRYLRYCVARLSAYRNVWWSLANEFDLMRDKTEADWDRFGQILVDEDPYVHLRSIHNSQRMYNYTKPWVTHASIQNGSAVEDFGRASLYRDMCYKPIVFDEVKYEGSAQDRWGHLTGQEMVADFWQGAIAGTYVGHSEVFRQPSQIDWLSTGGTMAGQSPPRLAFLKKVMETAPPEGINPIDKWQDLQTGGQPGRYYLVYLGKDQPKDWLFELPRAGLSAGMLFKVDVLDTWEMTITPAPGQFKIVADARYRYHADGLPKVGLPGKPYIALRITRVESN